VQLLLDKGADVNALGGSYSNALYTASARGYEEIVQLLQAFASWINVIKDSLLYIWNTEALGYQQFAEGSVLKAALVRCSRWPIQRDANGFPIE